MECSIKLCERHYDGFNVTNAIAEIPSFTTHELRYVDAEQGPLTETQATDLRLDFESVNGYNYSVNAADSETSQVTSQSQTSFGISNTLIEAVTCLS